MAESALVFPQSQTQLSPKAPRFNGQQRQDGMSGWACQQFQPSRLRPGGKGSHQVPFASQPLFPNLIVKRAVKLGHRLQFRNQDRALAFHPRQVATLGQVTLDPETQQRVGPHGSQGRCDPEAELPIHTIAGPTPEES
jgi:hypothetical protein